MEAMRLAARSLLRRDDDACAGRQNNKPRCHPERSEGSLKMRARGNSLFCPTLVSMEGAELSASSLLRRDDDARGVARQYNKARCHPERSEGSLKMRARGNSLFCQTLVRMEALRLRRGPSFVGMTRAVARQNNKPRCHPERSEGSLLIRARRNSQFCPTLVSMEALGLRRGPSFVGVTTRAVARQYNKARCHPERSEGSLKMRARRNSLFCPTLVSMEALRLRRGPSFVGMTTRAVARQYNKPRCHPERSEGSLLIRRGGTPCFARRW
jgi:hypothetical protein